jgi:aminopeptidase-like protein
LGEPQLSKRNLRSNFGAGKGLLPEFKIISDFLAYADGSLDLVDIANILDVYVLDLIPVVDKLLKNNLIKLFKSN